MGDLPDQFGRYVVRSELGRGISIVMEGWDPLLKRQVAIKVLRLDARDPPTVQRKLMRFRREAEITSALVHPNIVALFDYGEDALFAYTVMELLPGKTLEHLLGERQRLPLLDAIPIIRGLLSALMYVHGRGIVHRDIKPANVLLTADNKVKLADFGVAVMVSGDATEKELVVGTPAYMSPEQRAARPADKRSDLYTVGVVLQEILTGRAPFVGDPAAATRRPLDNENISCPAPLRAALEQLLSKAMAKSPRDRFVDAEAFDEALCDAMKSNLTQAEELHPRHPQSRTRVLAGGVALIVVSIAMGVVLYLRRPALPEDPNTLIKAAIKTTPCNLVSVEGGVAGEPLRVSGIVGSLAEGPLREAVSKATQLPVAWRLANFVGPYCGVLDLLRPLAGRHDGAAHGLALAIPDGRSAFEAGDLMRIDVTAPNFAAHLRLDYLSNDGSVLHVAPGAVFADEVIPAAGHAVVGTPTDTFRGWQIQKPLGRDLILAIASANTLALPPPAAAQEAQTAPYLTRLQDAISVAIARGDAVAATVLLVDTLPKASAEAH